MADSLFTLCADDFALSPAVSAGILEALAARRLTAVSAMTNRPDWPRSALTLKAFEHQADIGLHLNLTLGTLLGAMPRLAATGVFPTLRSLVGARLAQEEIAAEIARQLDAFAAAFGRPPDFIDGHQHVHALPGVRGALFAALDARRLGGRLWLRDSADGIARILARGVEPAKASAVAILAWGFGRQARARGFATNAGFAGFSAFDPARDYGRDFARYLQAPGPRHLVMCHPGRVDAELAALDPVTTAREAELAFLLSPAFGDTFAARLRRLTRS